MKAVRYLGSKGSPLSTQRGGIHQYTSSSSSSSTRRQWPLIQQQRAISSDSLVIDPKVSSALSMGKPVVALESTIITHGMPYPQNLRTAEEVERLVVANGVTPATVALIRGKLHVGLDEHQLQQLVKHSRPVKASRRDLAWAVSKGLSGGTTVSGTMIGAHAAGIHVFVTGGIGGVHREGQTSMDVSADLTELGRTPVAVISAGIKSILDIPRTLEYLETQGVTVATYGDSRDFPAFYLPSSGHQAPINVTCPREAAELIESNLTLRLGSGILIGVPIPSSLAGDGAVIEQAIQDAVQQARDERICGKDVTPFILQRVNELTKGQSLRANIALIKNNAVIGSRIAAELSQIRYKKSTVRRNRRGNPGVTSDDGAGIAKRPVVIGGCNIDLVLSIYGQTIMYGDATNLGGVHVTAGGVGRNIADCLSRLGASPLLVSVVGRDANGETVLRQSSHMDLTGVAVVDGCNTAAFTVVLDSRGSTVLSIGDMDISNQVTPKYVSQFDEYLRRAPIVCVDSNVPTETIQYICDYCSRYNIPVWYEPTCLTLATKPLQSDAWKSLSYISPNVNELVAMYNHLGGDIKESMNRTVSETIELSLKMARRLLHHIYCVVVTLGGDGVLVCRAGDHRDPFLVDSTVRDSRSDGMSAVHYPACTVDGVTSVSGAGDCLVGAMIAGIVKKSTPDGCAQLGLLAARCSTQSYLTVPPSVSESINDESSTQTPYVIPFPTS